MSPSVHAAQAANLRGRHICLPFETESEKENAVISLFHEGLARGRRCLFVGARTEYERVGVQLEEKGICALRAESRGALLYMTREDAYLENGAFDPNVVLGRVDRFIAEALADGFTGLCATGELIDVPSDDLWRQIVWYEAQVNEYFSRLPFVGLCRYARATIPPHRVQDVLRNHPIAVVRGETCDNPFYERPDLALSDDPAARLDWQLRQVRMVNRVQRQLEGKATSAVTAAVELATELEMLRSTIRSTETQ
ncbi:MAG TPA: MEDS domain-containing protein [Polyangia bacterium]